MKLGFSTNAFTRYSVREAVEKIALIGYEGVELLADVPHLYAPTTRPSELAQLKEVLAACGVAVSNINANTAVGYYGRQFWEPLFEPSLANPDEKERRWRLDYTKRCIDMAAEMECPCISVTSGRPVPGILPEKALDLLKDSLAEVLDHAAGSGIRVGIEYEPGLLIECFQELAPLLCDMESPWLGANLDLGHSHVLGEDPEVVIRGLRNRLFHVHLEDIRAAKHYHLIPGSGDLEFKRLFNILESCGYEGFVTVELYTYPHEPERAARAAWDYLRTFEELNQGIEAGVRQKEKK
jgi:fructoselysine 3-epimerase